MSAPLPDGHYWVRLEGEPLDLVMERNGGAWHSAGAVDPWPDHMITVTSPRLVPPIPWTPGSREHKVAFGIGSGSADGVPVLVMLISQAAWDYMQGGLGHDFDLTNVGLPLKLVLGRTESYDTGLAELRAMHPNAKDATAVDMSINAPRRRTQ